MRQLFYVVTLGALAACSSAAQRDAEHYATDNAIYAECEALGYVPGTTPFRECKHRLSERLDHEPYRSNRHSHPPRR